MWTPIEGDPSILNEYVYALTKNEKLQIQDVFSFDDLTEDTVGGQLGAVIINYPLSVPVTIPSVNFEAKFVRQTIDNACFTVALLHSLLNRDLLSSFTALEDYEQLHQQYGAQGETTVDNDTEMHYIAIVPVNGHAVWFDGRSETPVDLGSFGAEFGRFVADNIKTWIDLSAASQFAAFALVCQ